MHTETLNELNAPFYTRWIRYTFGNSDLTQNLQDLTQKLQNCWNKTYPKATASLNAALPAVNTLTADDCENHNGNGNNRPFWAKVFHQTMFAARNGFLVGKEKVELDKNTQRYMQEHTEVMRPEPLLANNKVYPSTKVQVLYGDCVEVGLKLKREGYRPVVLNMANESSPGGGVKDGSRAQEESICRRSDYMLALDPKNNPHLKKQMPLFSYYNIPTDGVIYTPCVQIFREESSGGFSFKHPQTLDFIASAAHDTKRVGRAANYVQMTEEKIRAQLRAAFARGNDTIVLSAFGCGAFGNDPKEVADIYAKVLKEPEFAGKFRKIVFAIIDDRNGTNYRPFYRKLHGIVI